MRSFLLFLCIGLMCTRLSAQQVDSIYFHLYTDSLKKGTHNYINVDGKMSDGRWQPLTSKEVQFSASSCEFSGNDLVVPSGFAGQRVTVKATLRSNPAIWKETTIWIKIKPDPEVLPSKEEVMRADKRRRRKG